MMGCVVSQRGTWVLAAVIGASGCASVQQAVEDVSETVMASTQTPGAVAVGREVQDTLRAGDVHRYEFQARQGQEIQVFFQHMEDRRAPAPQLRFMNPTENASIENTSAHYRSQRLEDHTTGTFEIPEDGVYVVRVTGDDDQASGRYRFKVEELNRAPEAAPAEVRAGQIVEGERIDVPFDIDEFHYRGAEAEEIRVSFQGLGGRGTPHVQLRIRNASGNSSLAVISSRGDAVTLDQNSRAVTLPAAGTYVLEVSGTERYAGLGNYVTGGPYRFRVERVKEGRSEPTARPAPGASSSAIPTPAWAGTYSGRYSYKVVGDAFSAEVALRIRPDGTYEIRAVEHGQYDVEMDGRSEMTARGLLLLAPANGRFRAEPPCRLTRNGDQVWGLAPCMGWRHLDAAVDDPMPLTMTSRDHAGR